MRYKEWFNSSCLSFGVDHAAVRNVGIHILVCGRLGAAPLCRVGHESSAGCRSFRLVFYKHLVHAYPKKVYHQLILLRILYKFSLYDHVCNFHLSTSGGIVLFLWKNYIVGFINNVTLKVIMFIMINIVELENNIDEKIAAGSQWTGANKWHYYASFSTPATCSYSSDAEEGEAARQKLKKWELILWFPGTKSWLGLNT